MSAPKHLRHKPIIEVSDYEQIDSHFYNRNTSDAKALSIGKAQFDDTEITAKVWRKPKKRWSPQSEELPLHRVIDLAIFIIENLKSSSQGIGESTSVLSQSELNKIEDFYKKNKSEFDTRIEELRKAINKF